MTDRQGIPFVESENITFTKQMETVHTNVYVRNLNKHNISNHAAFTSDSTLVLERACVKIAVSRALIAFNCINTRRTAAGSCNGSNTLK